MRDHEWLQKQLDHLLKTYFSNVKITNPVEIRFGREAKYRFGSIKLYEPSLRSSPRRAAGLRFGSIRLVKPRGFKLLRSLRSLKKREPQKSIITITSMFARERVPVKVVQYTIAHELCHFAHGFSSANRRLFKYPHHGGIVNAELTERGAEHLISSFKKWLKVYRKKILVGRAAI